MNISHRILISTCISCFIGPFMASSINVAIPTMAAEFNVPADQLSWIITIFLLGTAATLLPCGKLSGTLGCRRCFMTGVITFAVFSLGVALSPTLFWLIAFRALQGISLSFIFSSYLPLMLKSHPAQQGKVIGISSAATYLGLSAGPFIGGILTQYISWRAVFLFSFFALLITYAIMVTVKEEWFGEKDMHFDWFGSMVSMPAIVFTIYGLSAYNSTEAAKYILFAGLMLTAFFLWHEHRVPQPIIPLPLFHNITFSMSNLASLAHYSATYAVTFLLSFHLQLILHLDAAVTGTILLIQPIIMAIFSTKAGSLSDRHNPRHIAAAGITLTACCLTVFACTAKASVIQTILILFFLGIGAALFVAPNTNAILSSSPEKQQGIVSSILALMRILGQTFSMSVVTVILVHATSFFSDYEQAISEGIHLSFILLSLMCVCGIAASLMHDKNHA